MEADFQDRPEPQPITQSGEDRGRLTLGHLVFLLVLMVSPALALLRLAGTTDLFRLLLGYWVVVSLLTYILYLWDKSRARAGKQRASETMLHLCELAGGWPGAFLAQRRLRHKNSKIMYQFMFWLIVLVHQYVATDYQLGWRITRAAIGAAAQK